MDLVQEMISEKEKNLIQLGILAELRFNSLKELYMTKLNKRVKVGIFRHKEIVEYRDLLIKYHPFCKDGVETIRVTLVFEQGKWCGYYDGGSCWCENDVVNEVAGDFTFNDLIPEEAFKISGKVQSFIGSVMMQSKDYRKPRK